MYWTVLRKTDMLPPIVFGGVGVVASEATKASWRIVLWGDNKGTSNS